MVASLMAVLLAACGTDATPSTALPTATRPASEAPSVPASQEVTGSGAPVAPPSLGADGVAYSRAMCPIFTSILQLDGELAALRDIGASGGDVNDAVTELAAASDELLGILTALEEVPTWGPGAELRFRLISGLHTLRTQVLAIASDPGARTAPALLAALPFIASEAMDRSMSEAAAAGFRCDIEA